MRALVVALFLLTIVLVALPGPARAVSPVPCGPATGCKATIVRSIATNSWGVTVVTDTISMNSTIPVSQLTLGVPTNVSSDLRVFEANDTKGVNLAITTSVNQTYTALTVLFPGLETKYGFTLRTVYWGLLTYSASASSYTFIVNPFPVIDGTYSATGITTVSYAGGWSAPRIAPPINSTLQSSPYSARLTPFNTTVWKITFASATSQNLLAVSAARTITITPSASVQVTDAYNLTNLGPALSSIAFTVPKGVSSISESYVLGLEIDQPSTTPTPTANADGTSTVTFTPSFGSLSNNQTVRAKISYTLSPSTYISSGSLGSFTLNFALFNSVLFYAPTLQTTIVTPMGFRLNSATGQTYLMSGNQITFQISPLSNLGFSIGYQLDPFWSTVSPLTWVALIELALAGSVIAVWKGTGTGAVTGVPVQTITKFVDLYDEKSSMSMESDKMEEDVARGGLNKYDYRQRRRSLDRRMSEVDRALASVKADLAAESSRYADMTKRIERAEAELQVIRTTAADLKNQNRSGKISRDLYEQLSADLVRRKERAQQTIDTIIINLREEIR
jgi:archaellum component FlaC